MRGVRPIKFRRTSNGLKANNIDDTESILKLGDGEVRIRAGSEPIPELYCFAKTRHGFRYHSARSSISHYRPTAP
jgi:hypothetical protein